MAEALENGDGGDDRLDLKGLLFPGGDGNLVNKEEAPVASDAIQGKMLGLLIGPSWWKPLVLGNVIPSFADALEQIKVNEGDPLQMVYVPMKGNEDVKEQLRDSERGHEIGWESEDETFRTLIEGLPEGWLAVPPANSQAIDRLNDLIDNRVIALAFVADDGKILTTEGQVLLIEWGAAAYPFSDERLDNLEAPLRQLKENPRLDRLLGVEGGRDLLVKNDGTEVAISTLQGPIGIYFSAHWCPPCRQFTPKLVSVYEKLKSDGKHFEVVFVSWDRSEEDFRSYFQSMPWLALPFSDQSKKTLEKVYDVQGIPNLVILDSEGKTLQEDAVSIVNDFGEEGYPFTDEKYRELQAKAEAEKEARRANQTLDSLFVTPERDYVVDHQKTQIKVSSLVGKTVGLYFSAHWCPPCRIFTPKLVQIYNEVKSQGKPFEIIFLSSDRSESAFESYHAEMPWLALPYEDRNLAVDTRRRLIEYFDIRGIPCLIIIGPDGKTVNHEGRATMEQFGAKAFPFAKEAEDEILKKLDEEMRARTSEASIPDHEHPLKLMKVPYRSESYRCDICSEGGFRWAYRCEECGYDVDVACIDRIKAEQEKESKAQEVKSAEADGYAQSGDKAGWICEGDVCMKA